MKRLLRSAATVAAVALATVASGTVVASLANPVEHPGIAARSRRHGAEGSRGRGRRCTVGDTGVASVSSPQISSARRIFAPAVTALSILGAALLSGGVVFAPSASAAGPSVPYTDSNAVGSIGLCDQQGHQISSGSVTTRPFAWRAVSNEPAPAPYNNAERTATLVVFQPQQALPAGDWSGMQMTSSSSYTNPANPMAAATGADQSLADVIAQYPPKWDGFLELRLYLSTANEQADNVYPALNIRVTGNTWQAVGGSSVNCTSGTAESIESALLPQSTTTTAPSTTKQPITTTQRTTVLEPTTVRAGRPKEPSAALASGAPTADAMKSSSAFPVDLVVSLGALVAVSAVTAILLRGRRASVRPISRSSTNHN